MSIAVMHWMPSHMSAGGHHTSSFWRCFEIALRQSKFRPSTIRTWFLFLPMAAILGFGRSPGFRLTLYPYGPIDLPLVIQATVGAMCRLRTGHVILVAV